MLLPISGFGSYGLERGILGNQEEWNAVPGKKRVLLLIRHELFFYVRSG